MWNSAKYDRKLGFKRTKITQKQLNRTIYGKLITMKGYL